MSLWDSFVDGIENTFGGIADIWNGKNPFGSGGGFNKLFKGVSDDIQDFAEGYTGERMARENLEAQQEQWDVQNALNERQFAEQKHQNWLTQWREDTAVQRKVADLKAAGFNPVLAAGGSGSPTSTVTVPSLRTAPAPQLSDYSSGIRGAVDQVLGLLSMKKDFAMKDAEISLLRANKKKVEEEAMGIRTENQYRDEYLGARNSGMILDNQLKDGTLQSKIRKSIQDVDINDRKILIMDLEKMLKMKDIDLKDIEIDIQKLVKEGKLTENQILDKKLELLSTKVLRECLDYENDLWDTEWYHKNYHLPKGFNPGWIGALGMLLGGLGSASVDHILNFFGGFIDSGSSLSSSDKPYKLSKSEIKQLLKRPEGSNWLWTKNMNKTGDYGVRRNF